MRNEKRLRANEARWELAVLDLMRSLAELLTNLPSRAVMGSPSVQRSFKTANQRDNFNDLEDHNGKIT